MSETVTNPSPETRRKPGRGLRIALVLSVMLNLLVLGVLAGGAMRAARFEPPPGQLDFRALWSALPDAARDDLRAMGRERGFPGEHGPRPSREDREAHAAETNARIVAALRAEPFDAEGFARLLNGDREAFERRLAAARDAFAGEVAGLSPAERAAMADRLAQHWHGRMTHRDHD